MQEIYSLSELAQLLHRSEKELLRDVDRGLLEGRQVRGQWRFLLTHVVDYVVKNIIDVHVEDVELKEVIRCTAERAREEQAFFLKDLFFPELVAIPLNAKTSEAVIRDMTKMAADSGKLWDIDRMREAIREREKLCSTAMPNGVALPHSRTRLSGCLQESFVMLAILPRPIPFGGPRGQLTDVFFMICSNDDSIHLRILAKLARLLARPDFLENLRNVMGATDAIDLIARTEQEAIEA